MVVLDIADFTRLGSAVGHIGLAQIDTVILTGEIHYLVARDDLLGLDINDG
jgi:hypothetical protein